MKQKFSPLQKSIEMCFRKYADFQGRASRTEFWWFFVFQLGVFFAASLLGSFVNVLAFVALTLPGFAVACRRLHDTGRSGWWLLIALLPVAGVIVLLYFAAGPGQSEANAYGASAAVLER